VQALLDSLVIETYTQLATVAAVVAALSTMAVLMWRRRKTRRASGAKLIGQQRAAGRSPAAAPRVQTARAPKGMDFDRLADMIADASDRAGHISETQSAAALKLDTAEMAVNRLIADIDPLMAVPKTVRTAPSESTASPSRIPAAV
jgi:hypothetical protein